MFAFNQVQKNEPAGKVYRTAIYLRLSREDGDKAESDSIKNQRLLLKEYIKGHKEFKFMDEYVDDGFSGSNFERPAFQRMYADLQSGAINCVLLKDLSRFGRNYIEVGRYLEQTFPAMGIRLIAINDSYDSNNAWTGNDALIVPIRNLMNDAYCRDISVKIKSQLEIKRKRGDCVGNYVPYGYMRDKDDRAHLVIDEKTAEVVRNIFRWKLEGMSEQGIGNRLNEMGIPSPLEQRLKNGERISTHGKKKQKALWSANSVFRILHNDVYAGNMTQGKRKKIDYRSKRIVDVPPESWARVENTHEPIIERGLYDMVERVLNRDVRIAPGASSVTLFSGFLECGNCHDNLVQKSIHRGEKHYRYLVCNTYKKDKSCPTQSIRWEAVYDAVLAAIQAQISLVVQADRLLSDYENSMARNKRMQQLEKQLVQQQEETTKYQRIKQKLYADFAEGVLTKHDYQEYAAGYSEQIAKLQKNVRDAKKKLKAAKQEQNHSAWVESFRKYENISEVTRPLLVELVDKIFVYEQGRVEILFRHQDEMQALLEGMIGHAEEGA